MASTMATPMPIIAVRRSPVLMWPSLHEAVVGRLGRALGDSARGRRRSSRVPVRVALDARRGEGGAQDEGVAHGQAVLDEDLLGSSECQWAPSGPAPMPRQATGPV